MRINYYLLMAAILVVSCTGNKGKNDAGAQSIEANAEAPTSEITAESGETPTVDDRGYIIKVGDMASDFTLATTDGETFKLSDMSGKIIMLQFTASWCSVCRKEMPFIESDIWQKYKDNPDFCLLGIDRDEPLDKVLDFKKQTGITYKMALDPGGKVFSQYAERNAGITRNVIIDRTNRIVMLTRLYDEDEFKAMCLKIDELLGVK
jgi:peroxiredoxin